MTYQSMENANDGMPSPREKGTVQVVEEGGIDELDGPACLDGVERERL